MFVSCIRTLKCSSQTVKEITQGAAYKAPTRGNALPDLWLWNFFLIVVFTGWFDYDDIINHLLESLWVCSMILWSCWTAAGWSPKSTGRPANWIIPSSSTRPGSSSTWTQGCGTWRFITTAATWRQCPTTPSSRVLRCTSAFNKRGGIDV